jgi:hypothetical protein
MIATERTERSAWVEGGPPSAWAEETLVRGVSSEMRVRLVKASGEFGRNAVFCWAVENGARILPGLPA